MANKKVATKEVVPKDLFEHVRAHFGGDNKKTWEWFNTPHPSLCFTSPIKMINSRKIKQVVKFALAQLQLNL